MTTATGRLSVGERNGEVATLTLARPHLRNAPWLADGLVDRSYDALGEDLAVVPNYLR